MGARAPSRFRAQSNGHRRQTPPGFPRDRAFDRRSCRV